MVTAILLMAGKASRMKMSQNKVFLPLANKMVFQYALDLFISKNLEVVCVIKEEDRPYLKDYYSKVKIVTGGETRQESVYNGLMVALGDCVLIHDAARPFLSEKILDECLDSLAAGSPFLVAKPCNDTIYSMNPIKYLKREDYCLAQTPQGGKTKLLTECYNKALSENVTVTDDISLVLKYSNEEVRIIEGSEYNFKITSQFDYILAKEVVKR